MALGSRFHGVTAILNSCKITTAVQEKQEKKKKRPQRVEYLHLNLDLEV